jgi:hypothetical protein
LAVFALLTPLAHDSRAGQVSSPFAGCSTWSGGGSCSGTIGGFRNSGDPTAYAEFYQEVYAGGATRIFGAEINGTSYWCDASSVAAFGPAWPAIANMQNLAFGIQWNANNQCQYLTLYNESVYY